MFPAKRRQGPQEDLDELVIVTTFTLLALLANGSAFLLLVNDETCP